VFIGEPPRNEYDLHFNCFGFPVRISGYFWLAAGVMGAMRLRGSGTSNDTGIQLISWIVSMFVSILIHELGHAFAMRYYGGGARIVLYMMGGLAIPDSSGFGSSSYGSSSYGGKSYGGKSDGGKSDGTVSRVVISLAGPFAGFALAGVVVGLIYAWGGSVTLEPRFPYFWNFIRPEQLVLSAKVTAINTFFNDMLDINILWGLLNLLPIYPLDGGQVSRELLVAKDYRSGIENSLWLSVYTAGAVVVWGLYVASQSKNGGGMLMIMMFASLAYSSYQAIQQMRGGGHGGGNPW
jgi:stage IV sporulation protein FB